MAKMQIEMYRGTVKKAREFLSTYQQFMMGTDSRGLGMPMMYYEDIQRLRSEINQHIGEFSVLLKSRPVSTLAKYQSVLKELIQADMQLKELELAFLHDRPSHLV